MEKIRQAHDALRMLADLDVYVFELPTLDVDAAWVPRHRAGFLRPGLSDAELADALWFLVGQAQGLGARPSRS